MPATIYLCSKCGQEAEIKDGVIVRGCEHKDDSVIANISAKCKGMETKG